MTNRFADGASNHNNLHDNELNSIDAKSNYALCLVLRADDSGKKISSILASVANISFLEFSIALRKREIKINAHRIKKNTEVNNSDRVVLHGRTAKNLKEICKNIYDSDAKDATNGRANGRANGDSEFYVSKSLKRKIEENILYEDDDLIAINKPYGLATQGGKGVEISIDRVLNEVFSRNLRLVHRLDKSTTGILLLGKTESSTRILHEAFRNREVHKHYASILHGKMTREVGSKRMKEIDSDILSDGKLYSACTKYCMLSTNDDFSYANFYPLTGRKHQIRIHAASIGHPLIGDNRYMFMSDNCNRNDENYTNRSKNRRIFLHAHRVELEFKGRLISIECNLPQEFKNKLVELNLDNSSTDG